MGSELVEHQKTVRGILLSRFTFNIFICYIMRFPSFGGKFSRKSKVICILREYDLRLVFFRNYVLRCFLDVGDT